jgi:glycosyltransferase involved in cell wall biosynthesis
MSTQTAEVSVVIPTIGRRTAGVAVQSVRRQSPVPVEIIVVCDSPRIPDSIRELSTDVDQVLCTGHRRGGSHARNLGVVAAHADLVAFLDDDDEWLPTKLSLQVPVARELIAEGYEPIVSSRILQQPPGGPPLRKPTPSRLIKEGHRPEDYLFRRRRAGVDRPLLPTSTLLTTRRLAIKSRWDDTLSRHQDWDWLIRATRMQDVRLRQLEDATVLYTVGSSDSISATRDWRASWKWANAWQDEWDPKTYSDFLTSQPLRYAVQARDWEGVHRLVETIAKSGRPSGYTVAYALAGIIPRRHLERLALNSEVLRQRFGRVRASDGA